MKYGNKLYAGLLIASVTLMSISCGSSEKEKTETDEEVTYDAIQVKESQAMTTLQLPGELEGFYETSIFPKVNSYVKNLLVDIGDRVTKGQLLVELEAPELTSEVTEAYSKCKAAEARFINTKGKYIRLVQTNKTPGAVSPYDMDLAKTEIISDSLMYVAAKAKSEAMQELASYLKITAPFDGIITERNLAPGALVGPSEKDAMPIVKLKHEEKLRLHVAIPEKHLAEVQNGQEVKFGVKSYPNKEFAGKVTRVSSNISTQTRSEIVEIEIDNSNRLLVPGMFASVVFPISRNEKTIWVPQSAVATNMEHCFVVKSDNNTAVIVDIEKGNTLKDQVEIFGNIKPNDIILKTASDEIKTGTKIKTALVKQSS